MTKRVTARATAAKTQPADRARSQVKFVLAFFIAAMIASLAAKSFAQAPYDQIKLDPRLATPAMVKRMKQSLKSYAGAAAGTADDKMPAAQAYLGRYIPSRMTQPDGLTEINDLMAEASTAIASAQRRGNQQAVSKLMSAIGGQLIKLSKGNYQPAARIAATMMLGNLNTRPADRGNPPVPMSAVLPQLIKIYETADGTVPDAVRAAALHGIHRHMLLSFDKMPDAIKQKLLSISQGLLVEPVPPTRSPAAHAFVQRYAIDIQDYLNADDAQAAAVMAKISADMNRHDLVALYAAEKFGRSPGAAKAKIDSPQSVLDSMTVRAMLAFEKEAERLEFFNKRPPIASKQPSKPEDVLLPEEEEDEDVAGGDPMAGYGDDMSDDMQGYEGGGDEEMMQGYGMDDPYGGMMAPQDFKPQPAEVIATRRRLNQVLQQIHLGITGQPKSGKPSQPGGLLATADDVTKSSIDTWVTSMEEVVTGLNDRSLEDTKSFLDELQRHAKTLRKLAGDAADKKVEEPTVADENDVAGEAAGAGETLVNN